MLHLSRQPVKPVHMKRLQPIALDILDAVEMFADARKIIFRQLCRLLADPLRAPDKSASEQGKEPSAHQNDEGQHRSQP